ncbi:DEAD/DEAH box helicase [Mycoplasmopsis californica]|uniref:DEAD/DEAH box helicase n=1 Tax=Mycoplasmopsis californica TaxID=2113 RepID=UPI000EB75BB4|nr:DEAD/DEAH box helicase family protein [Mycoplasmopsis californica]BBG42653.1 DNA helicase [Mycoplasmopsis californica]
MIDLKLKNFQENAVDFLFNKTADSKAKPKIILQSPTGSGKTIILVAYIEKYLDYNRDDIICWFCPGKGELEEQSMQKMKRFAPDLKSGSLNDVISSGFISGTTYFINWETITKKDNVAIQDSERKNLFERIAEAHRAGKNFIVIIDEEHQNNTSKADDIIASINAKYEIRVSATPVKRAVGEFHEISEIDVINQGLITRFMYINKDLDSVKVDNPKNEAELLLEKADQVRKEIAQAYVDVREDIRPLVLIQFPNLNDELIEFVENKLNSMGYTYENKLLASWFSAENKDDKDRKSKKLGKINIGTSVEDSITNKNATPVFLLFKQALATGWDCPRAKILVKLRENMNDTFEIQTLGRLRRMPNAKHYGKDILDCSYLYTFDEKYKLDVIKAGGAFETQRVFLKEEAKSIKLKKEFRNFDAEYVDEQEIRYQIFQFFKDKYSLGTVPKENKIRLENNRFIFGTTLKRSYLTGKYSTLSDVSDENTQHGTMEVKISTHAHGIDLQHCVGIIKKLIGLSYDKTNQILKTLFREKFGNDKYKLLNLNLKEFYGFIINNIQRLKEDFSSFLEQTIKDNLNDKIKKLPEKIEEFSIPLEEYYRYVPYENNIQNIETNVYKEYNSSMITDDFRSTSERLFEKFCDNNKNVKYLYKNGNSGQQYLSIVYDTVLKQRLFYPDYVVQLNDGSIWIIETKGGEFQGESKNIDPQAENKFIALKKFSQKNGYKFGFVRDKNNELFINNTDYVQDMNNDKWIPIKKIFDIVPSDK